MHICTPVFLQIYTSANQILQFYKLWTAANLHFSNSALRSANLHFSKSALQQICTFPNLHCAISRWLIGRLRKCTFAHLYFCRFANLHFCKPALLKSETYTAANLHSCVSVFFVPEIIFAFYMHRNFTVQKSVQKCSFPGLTKRNMTSESKILLGIKLILALILKIVTCLVYACFQRYTKIQKHRNVKHRFAEEQIC